MDFMKEALREAKKSLRSGDVPIGCVVVKDDQIIGRGFNQKELKKNPSRHAEIIAIEKACKTLNTWHLIDCVLYTTCEPCLMCSGAILQARISKVIYATSNEKFGCAESITNILSNPKNNHKVETIRGSHGEDSKELLRSFFESKRG